MIYFEMFPGDYLKDTTRLSLTDHGVYFKLMLAYYSEEQALPESLAAPALPSSTPASA